MNKQPFTVKFLGTRGSLPTCGREFLEYGGNSSCVLVRMGGEVIVLDAGSGMAGLLSNLNRNEKKVSVLISHPHLDHLLGLPYCLPQFDDTMTVDFYAPRGGISPEQQARLVMSPPLWPVGTEAIRAGMRWKEIGENPVQIGAVRVTAMESNHPGGSLIYKLSFGGKDIVYATDCECTESFIPRLSSFAAGCELLMIDAQYTPVELLRRAGYGHSSWQEAVWVGRAAAAARAALFHHDPRRTDGELRELQKLAEAEMPAAFFAREGEEIQL